MNAAPVIVSKICGEQHAQRYTLVKVATASVYGSGRPGWGIKYQSDAERRLQSDAYEWYETSEADRDARIAQLVADFGA